MSQTDLGLAQLDLGLTGQRGQGAGCKQKKLQGSTIQGDDTLATLNHNLPPEDHSATFKSALGLHLKKNHLVHQKDLDLGNRWSDRAEPCYQAGPYVYHDGPAVESQVWLVDGQAIPQKCSSQAKIAGRGEQTGWASTTGGSGGPSTGCVRWPRLCPPSPCRGQAPKRGWGVRARMY